VLIKIITQHLSKTLLKRYAKWW